MTALEVRGMQPAAVLALIQSELGGETIETDGLAGDGWTIQAEVLPRAPLGRFALMALRLTITGSREAEIVPLVRRMLMRGGG